MANSVNLIAFQNRYLTAKELNAMSNENIYKYCFVRGSKTDWDTDFNDEICNNIEKYDLLKTLSGDPLSYIKTKIDYNMSNWIPVGKKLNPKLLYTLQTIIETDRVSVRNASLTGKINNHIADSCTRLTGIINKGFSCESSVAP